MRLLVASLALLIFAIVALAGCGPGIWNASDLAQWVRGEAVRAGCEPASVKLAEWYVSRDGENVWPVDCVNKETGKPVKLYIGVDKVWKPSK